MEALKALRMFIIQLCIRQKIQFVALLRDIEILLLLPSLPLMILSFALFRWFRKDRGDASERRHKLQDVDKTTVRPPAGYVNVTIVSHAKRTIALLPERSPSRLRQQPQQRRPKRWRPHARSCSAAPPPPEACARAAFAHDRAACRRRPSLNRARFARR